MICVNITYDLCVPRTICVSHPGSGLSSGSRSDVLARVLLPVRQPVWLLFFSVCLFRHCLVSRHSLGTTMSLDHCRCERLVNAVGRAAEEDRRPRRTKACVAGSIGRMRAGDRPSVAILPKSGRCAVWATSGDAQDTQAHSPSTQIVQHALN